MFVPTTPAMLSEFAGKRGPCHEIRHEKASLHFFFIMSCSRSKAKNKTARIRRWKLSPLQLKGPIFHRSCIFATCPQFQEKIPELFKTAFEKPIPLDSVVFASKLDGLTEKGLYSVSLEIGSKSVRRKRIFKNFVFSAFCVFRHYLQTVPSTDSIFSPIERR